MRVGVPESTWVSSEVLTRARRSVRVREPAGAIRVLLADGDVALRLGVRAALEASGMVVCGEVSHSADALRAAREQRPDVALMDVRMDADAMLAVIAALRAELP